MRKRALSKQARSVLEALLPAPLDWRYGYELSKRVGLSSGTLYPVLIRLHERGLLEAKWVEAERPGRPARHAYRLTVNGAAVARTLADAPDPRPSSGEEVFA
jgi:DNA-binding PadR family transcriptional regulator